MKKHLLTMFTTLLCGAMVCSSCATNHPMNDNGETSESAGETSGKVSDTTDSMDTVLGGVVFYVAVDGDDKNDGSAEAPFATLKRAITAIKKKNAAGRREPITVRIQEGVYSIDKTIKITSSAGGSARGPITFEAVGNVVFNGGIILNGKDFEAITEEEKARLHGDAVEHVMRVDLAQYGLSSDDWGSLSAIGTYSTAGQYTRYNKLNNLWLDVYVNDVRQTLARYPNNGYIYTTAPVKEGDALMPLMSEIKYTDAEWWKLRNPAGDVNGIDAETAQRAASWATLNDVWMFGYPRFDWADMSSPVIAIDAEDNTMSTEFVSIYGLKEHAAYYFYNVFEELDAPGEWYLDRHTGMLYLYAEDSLTDAEITLSLGASTLIELDGANYVTFRGLTFTGAGSGSALQMNGNHLRVENCEIKNVAGNALEIKGNNNYVGGCHIHHLGCSGILLEGGNRATLTPSGTVVENNHIHHFGEVYRTYQAAISVPGCGHLIRNNEIHDAPHMAIGFGGNDNIIEYNEIYRVCQEADDSGAIYGGRDYTAQGNIIRYNYFHDIYSIADINAGVFAIYCDDAMGGSIIEHNIFANCSSAQMYHGGHNMVFRENLIVDVKGKSNYSIRFLSYVYENDLKEGGQHLINLATVPWQNSIWTSRFPQIGEYLTWSTKEQCYPHYCDISHNIIINHNPIEINFDWDKRGYGNRMNNNIELESHPVKDYRQLCEEVLPEEYDFFDVIPFSQIGRHN